MWVLYFYVKSKYSGLEPARYHSSRFGLLPVTAVVDSRLHCLLPG